MDFYEEIIPLVEKAELLLRESQGIFDKLDSIQALQKKETPFQLLYNVTETILSTLFLLRHRAIFDAEILLRSVFEGTIKFCFMMNGKHDMRNSRIQEYESLATLYELKDFDKSTKTRQKLYKFDEEKADYYELYKYNILKQKQEEKLIELDRKELKEIEFRWKFAGLLTTLQKSEEIYEAQEGMREYYALGCHITHCDWMGVTMRFENAQITDNLQKNIEDLIHGQRIICNLLSCTIFSITEIISNHHNLVKEYKNIYNEIFDYSNEIGRVMKQTMEFMTKKFTSA